VRVLEGPSPRRPGQAQEPGQARETAIYDWVVCPRCRGPLDRQATADTARCSACAEIYERRDGVWGFLPAERAAHYERFVSEYERVRAGEGRGPEPPEFYRALPLADLTGRFRTQWKIRARTFQVFVTRVLPELAAAHTRALRIIDVGAGNGWLSNHLALRGHQAMAVDLVVNASDGLGAHRHYLSRFLCAQAESDHLPAGDAAVDMVVYNASLHYSTKYEITLGEALRVLAPGGRLVIADSPIYRDGESGRAMMREREAAFVRAYGTRSDAIATEGFLTWSRIEGLGRTLNIHWTILRPDYGLSWALAPLRARLRGRREPARFALLVGTK
jgi:SAM-dependent methyltransferase